jgi:hypothetical protein
MTDRVITSLDFTYLDDGRAVTTSPAQVAFVQIEVTAQGDTLNVYSGGVDTYTARSEVRLRAPR